MSLKTGQWSGYRKPEQVAAIKQAISDGQPFAKFWAETASKWPEHSSVAHVRATPTSERGRGGGREYSNSTLIRRLRGLYTYYAYRDRGDARFVNGTASRPSRYTVEQKAQVLACIRDGKTFSAFWTEFGSKWKKVPLYRLRNYYRLQQKRFRDMRELDPQLDASLAALAQTLRQGGGGAAPEVPTQPAKVEKLVDKLSRTFDVARGVVSAALRRLTA